MFMLARHVHAAYTLCKGGERIKESKWGCMHYDSESDYERRLPFSSAAPRVAQRDMQIAPRPAPLTSTRLNPWHWASST